MRDDVAGVRLGVRVLPLGALAKERRQRDGSQDPDDQDHNEELDKGETLLLVVQTLAELRSICLSSFRGVTIGLVASSGSPPKK